MITFLSALFRSGLTLLLRFIHSFITLISKSTKGNVKNIQISYLPIHIIPTIK